MKKKALSFMAIIMVLTGCNQINPSMETIGASEATSLLPGESNAKTTEATDSTTESGAIESTIADISATTDTVATETASAAETEAVTISTAEETSFISIDITTAEETTSGSGRMETANRTYENNNILINYPSIVGMSDIAAQDWANNELYNDAMQLLSYYNVDEENDSFELNYTVSTLYRGEFSLVYEGTFTQKSTGYTYKVKAAEDLDLATKEHICLSNRLASSKLIKSVLEDGDYEIIDCGVQEDTIRQYLSTQEESFFKDIVDTADFGNSENISGVFSYNNLGNVAIVIPLQHIFGDYVVISIKQQTK